MNIKLSPSMLSIDFGKVAEQLKIVEDAGTPYIHLDVMDGIFVPNISFGIPVIKSIRKDSNMVFDAHLMIVEPEKYVEEFRKAGADIINFHVEATKYPAEVIQQIKATGAKAGITINPVAFLVVKDGDVTIKHIVSNDNAVERAVSLVPEMFDKVTNLAKKKKADAEADVEATAE